MKRTALILITCMMLSSFAASAADFKQYQNPCEVPASVYKEPYMDTQISTTYAPWLKNLHLASKSQLERGAYAGEACQQIRGFAISPINTDIMYFSTDTTGIYTTKNGGKSWYNTNNGYPGQYTRGILCDVLDENTVYFVGKKAGVARSRDGGRHWEELIKDKSTMATYQQILAMDAAGNLYAALPRGIFKVDRKTEEVTNLYTKYESATGDKGVYFYDIDVSPDGMHIYAAAMKNSSDEEAEYGIFTSHDGGKTWDIKGGNDKKTFAAGTIVIHPEDPMRIFVGGRYYDKETKKAETYTLYESTDGANTLKEKFILNYENLEEGVSKTPVLFYYLTFGPKNENGIHPLYLAGQKMTWNYVVSYDYGSSFERVITPKMGRITEQTDTCRYPAGSKGYTGYFAQHLAVDPKVPGRVLLNYLGPAIYDNGKLTTISSGFSGASVSQVALDSQARPFLVTVDIKGFVWESGSMKEGDVFTVYAMDIDEGSKTEPKEHTFTKAVFDPNDDNHLIGYVAQNNAKPDFDGVRQSFDKGATWEPFNEETIFQKGKAPRGATKVLCYDPDDSNTIYTSYHTSHDNGKTWERNSMSVMAISPDFKKFLGMTGSGTNAVLHVSEDKGKTWKETVKPGYSSDIKGIFFDTVDSNFVWIARGSTLHRIDLTTGKIVNHASKLNNCKINRFDYNPEIPGHMIVCSSPGLTASDKDFKIAETRDNGETWHYVPGSFGGFFGSITFTGGFAYIGGHQGTLQYDYKKYWEFLDSKITVKLNDKEISFSVMPEITNSRAMVPMRDLFEKLGATVEWNSDTQTVSAKRGAQRVSLQIGNDKAAVNGKQTTLDAPPYILNGKTMIPLRLVSEALGLHVGWDEAQRLIVLKGE